MDLQFTEEQIILRDMVKSVCDDCSTTAVVRSVEKDAVGIAADLWSQLKETGILSMLVPEEHGGMGLGMLDCALIMQELGAALAPGPYFDSAIMAATVINRAGSEEQKAELLPAIAAGELIVSNAWLEPGNGFGPEGVQIRATRTSEGYVLNGSKRHVFYAKAAQKLIVLARTGDQVKDVDLFLVDCDAEGVVLEQQQSMAYDSQYKVTFNQLQMSAAQRIGAEGSGWDTWDAAMHQGIILLAAWAAGGAERALEMTVKYSKERHQFGKPLAAFQALSHYMADCYTVIEGAKTLVLEAAWAYDENKCIKRLAPMAKLFSCNTFRDVTAKCEQIHGGYGFTLEYDIQLFFRRAKQLQMNWWDSRYLEDLISVQVLDTEGRTIDDPFKV